MKLRNSTFFKYVISYVLVLSVAFVGFYAVVQFQLEREYRSVYQDETERKIQNISIVLDQDLSDILVMNYIIENNTAFIFARYSESSYDRYLAVSELKKLSMTNALVKDILYFDIQNEDVLSANTSVACKDGDYYLKTAAGDLLIPPELIFEKSSENTLFALSIGETSFYFFPAAKIPQNSELFSSSMIRSFMNGSIHTQRRRLTQLACCPRTFSFFQTTRRVFLPSMLQRPWCALHSSPMARTVRCIFRVSGRFAWH